MVARIRRVTPSSGVVVLVDNRISVETVVRLMRMNVTHVFEKPVAEQALVEVIREELREQNPNCMAFRIDAVLRERATQQDMSLQSLSQAVGVSRGYIVRLFRENLKTSFRQRLRFYRIGNAQDLLERTDLTIDAIASRCGFRNARRLAEAFRAVADSSPSVYRRMFRSQKETGVRPNLNNS